ncbi:ferredoxin [Plantactinospora soyae]|uniref:Ferredoxin n=1 Tax=Plantactinospora soyae TaxID=1544732 RepID=A0A927M2Q5_9ACTN|nr:ferredoxin [Plantactinospora soyae]MBE1484478.1 ferredoxin [Plantactinospora soyae]
MALRVHVDRDHCELHGQCVERLPAVFRFTDAGDLDHLTEAGDDLADDLADAQFLCPTQAIEVGPA